MSHTTAHTTFALTGGSAGAIGLVSLVFCPPLGIAALATMAACAVGVVLTEH